MRKIISILVALGLVLGLSAIATPVAADVTEPQVSLSNYCACAGSAYNISFNTSASLTEGVHSVCIAFPAGTTIDATKFDAGEILINSTPVFISEVTVTGTTVCFLTPIDFAAGPILVEFALGAGIKNPCVADDYTLFVSTDRAPDATPVESEKYTIIPAVSHYVWLLDFSPTYPGIAPEFVPPFKACGQEDFGTYNDTIDGYVEAFNLTLMADPVGCDVPCPEAEIYLKLMAVPDGGAVTLFIGGTWFTLDAEDLGEKVVIDPDLPLTPGLVQVWASLIHFDTKGDYQICFYAECPYIDDPCDPEAEELFADRCVDFSVYQWKDAAKITLQEKWNLISLPLVPLVDPPVEETLASIPLADRANILSIWHYDRCSDTWATWGNGQSSLTELVDGEAYWVRVTYPITDPACGNITWWVWGTEKPMPPASPAEYPVCDGWNMVGFLGTAPLDPDLYLWNWFAASNMPVIYGWDQGCWTAQGWNLIDTEDLTPGQGYWMAFNGDGAVYVP